MEERTIEIVYIGMQRNDWKGCGDGYTMEYNEKDGLVFCIFFQNPSESEKLEISTPNDFEIRFSDFEGIGFFSIKIGDLPWGDCAFTPNLYPYPLSFPEPEEGKGLTLKLLLIDSATGTLDYMRVIGLGERFSTRFCEWCKESLKHNISRQYYDKTVKRIYQNYSQEELSKKMLITYKVPHREDVEQEIGE